MIIILNIDTATENASVCLSGDKEILGMEESADQKNHAAFVQPAIRKIMQKAGYRLGDIDAVSVTGGPGSYTGLRVGLSSAKGLCYTLKKPLILVNTLEVMASASVNHSAAREVNNQEVLFCPMIDARRMEVFTALYNSHLQLVKAPAAIILNENSFRNLLDKRAIVFSGSGSHKFKNLLDHPNAFFSEIQYTASHLSSLSYEYFLQEKFSDPAYSEPFYLKEFFTPVAKNQ